MRAEELRIGNFIGLNLEEFPENYFRVLEPAEKSMKVTGYLSDVQRMETDFFDADLMDGIPLTEYWLKRFGFVDPDNRDGYGGLLSPQFNGSRIRVKDNSWMCYESTVRLDYVHQLQNLYFALTGTELKLN